MSYDWACLQADLEGRPHPARHILYTLTGFGANCWTTYPADIARAISPDIASGLDENWWWQPVSYGSNGLGGIPGAVPAAFPMQPSIDDGVREMSRLMQLHPPTQTWGFVAYSEGSIVSGDIMDLCGITQTSGTTPLAAYKDSFIGGVTFGCPRREKGHTLPNGIDPGGHGIVQPNLVGTPASVLDFAAGKHMPGSPGQDLYTTSGYDGDIWTAEDESAVWEIVRTGSFSGAKPLMEQILRMVENPIHGLPSATVAILDTLDFFVLHGLSPHTSYQNIRPLPGDNRSCWDIALDYVQWLGRTVPARQ